MSPKEEHKYYQDAEGRSDYVSTESFSRARLELSSSNQAAVLVQQAGGPIVSVAKIQCSIWSWVRFMANGGTMLEDGGRERVSL